MKHFTSIILCGTEMVSFEVSNAVKVVSCEISPQAVKSTVTKLMDSVTCDKLLISDSVDEVMNKHTRADLKKITKGKEPSRFDSVRYV